MADKKRNTGESNEGWYNSGDRNSGDYNSGYYNSGNRNSGNRNSGDRNSGDYNSGYYNSGDWNSGICNTNEPKMRAFNKECDYTYSEFRDKWGYKDIELPITAWINKEDMTDKEKEEVDGWETMGGYLKSDLTYKEAWKVAWDKATQEQKDWYMSFPNFDADIWLEITGIDVKVEDDKTQEALELLKSKGYKIVKS